MESAILLWLYFPTNLDWESFWNFTSTGIISHFVRLLTMTVRHLIL